MSGLRIEDDGAGVRRLTLDRVEVRNALTIDLRRRIPEALAAADADPSVRVVVLTGAGGHFCAGADLNEFDRTWTPAEAAEYVTTLAQPTFRRLRAMATPTVARVEGVAAGAGMFLALGCDIVVAADDARFKVPFTELGVPAEAGSTYLFPMRMGWQRAAKVLFTSEWLTAEDVVDAGIALERCPAARVLERTVDLAEHIASLSPDSVQAIKRLLVEAHLDHVVAARRREEAAFAELLPRLAGEAG